MDRTTFVQHVLGAVSSLDETARLAKHPLASFLFPGLPADEAGRQLGEVLRAAIGELRPREVTETNLGALRRYQYLDRRYLRGLRAAHVAQDLGLSDRQARRIHQEAIEALAGIVWSRRQRAIPAPFGASPVGPREAEPAASELEAEVARLGTTPVVEGASLGEVIRSALATVAPLAARHRVEVDIPSLPSLPLLAVDRAVLRQVLVNLLVSWIEANARRIEVGVRSSCAALEVAFTIWLRGLADSKPNDYLEHDEPLRVVQRLLQLQAGTIEARATDDARRVVALTVPVVQPATILLVDDNPDTLRLFRRYLSGGGYRPIEASDSRQALALARQAQPRAIVLDVMLPSQDGWEILQALRNDLATERIPVVICSVLHQEELAHALGATAYLAKPVSRDAFLMTLRRVMTRPVPSPAPPARAG